jgi:hypothetical protein
MRTNETQSSEPADGDHVASASGAVLIFDGECPLCSAAATARRRLPEVGVVADNVERIAGIARDVAGGGRQPADLDGTRSLSAAGAAEYRTLATSARSTHGTGESRETARPDTEDTVYASL